MIIFYTFGGGIFIAVFVLMIVSGMISELGESTNSFISENIAFLIVTAIIISVLIAILGAKIWGTKRAILPMFLMVAQFFFFLIRGLHYVTGDPYESSFLMLFSFIIYIAALIFDAFVMLATLGFNYDEKRIIPLYLAGVAGSIFGYFFF